MARSHFMMTTADGAGPRRAFRPAALVATLIAASVIPAPQAAAQARAGGHVLYLNELFDGSTGYGGRVEFDLDFLVEELVVGGTYDRVFPECGECTFWEAGGQVGFYSGIALVGMGLSFSRFENPEAEAETMIEDDWSWSLLASIRYPLKGFFTPFFEIRNELGEGILNSQTLVLGIFLGPSNRRVDSGTSGSRTR